MKALRTGVVGHLLATGTALSGCAQIFGFEEGKPLPGGGGGSGVTTYSVSSGQATTATGSPNATTGGGGAGGTCAVCAPQVPSGWTGPVTFLSGDAAKQGCAKATVRAGQLLVADPPSCTCKCGPACAAPTLSVYSNACPGAANTTNLTVGCAQGNLPVPLDKPHSFSAATSNSCTPDAMQTIPALALGAVALVCTHDAATGSCSAGTCVAPLPQGGALCVYRQGPGECPASYPVAHQVVDDLSQVIDTRACSQCTCGAPGAGKCSGTVSAYASTDCSGTPKGDNPIDGACYLGWYMDGAGSIKVAVTGPACQAQGGQASGGVQLKPNALTVCCAPPL